MWFNRREGIWAGTGLEGFFLEKKKRKKEREKEGEGDGMMNNYVGNWIYRDGCKNRSRNVSHV